MATARIPLIIASLIASLSSIVAAQDLEKSGKALTMIGDFAERICKDPTLRGSISSIDAQGKAKVEASKLVKQLAHLNVEGALKFSTSDYEGLMQKDLLPALKDTAKCKQKIFDDLKDRFLPLPKSFKSDLRTTAVQANFKAFGFAQLQLVPVSNNKPATLHIFEPDCELKVWVSDVLANANADHGVFEVKPPPEALIAQPFQTFSHTFIPTEPVVLAGIARTILVVREGKIVKADETDRQALASTLKQSGGVARVAIVAPHQACRGTYALEIS